MQFFRSAVFSRAMPILAICALAASFALGCTPPKDAKPRPVASKGVLDLRQWNFEKDGPIDLTGEWEFYWKQLLAPSGSPAEPREVEGKMQYIHAPGKWNAQAIDGKEVGGQGFATYRLKVLMPPNSKGLGFHIPDGQGSAHETYVGAQLAAHNGKVGRVADVETPQYLPQYGALPDLSELFLTIHISNHVHQNGGLQTPIRIGLQATFQTVRDRARLLEGFLIGAFIVMGLYHLALYFYRRKDWAAFYFGLLCLMMSLRTALTGERLLIETLPTIPWIIVFKLEYLSFFVLIPGWTFFLYNLFPREIGHLPLRIVVFLSLPPIVAAIALPPRWFTFSLAPYQIFTIVSMCYAIVSIARAVLRKQQGARLILAGFLVFFSASINDILYNQFLIGVGLVLPLGLFFFIFAQAGALAHRIATAFNTSEDLSANLEVKIEERTKALEKAKEETEALNNLIKSLNEDMEITVIMKKVHEFIKGNFGIQFYNLAVLDKEKERLVTIDSTSPEYFTKENREKISNFSTQTSNVVGAHALAFKVKRPAFFPKIRYSGMTPEELALTEAAKLQSLLIIPLILQNEPIGFLDLYNVTKMELSKDDIIKLSILGEQLAGIIHGSKLFKEVELERQKSERLLLNILPQNVATELKVTGAVVPQHFESASVLFTDFVGFTKISETMSAADLIKELDGCFSQFDEVIKRNNLEKLKTIGDAYMCAGGIPVANNSHAVDVCLAALEFRAFMLQMQEIKAGLGLPFWQLRIGINTGPVTAGVVGTNKFAYDIWGDTVNTASRMESSGEPGHVNISQATYERVKDFFDCEYRGKVKAKGKGEVEMYFLLRIKPEFSADAAGRIPNAKFEMQRVQLGV
jgi:class 3 adenylate cyclase